MTLAFLDVADVIALADASARATDGLAPLLTGVVGILGSAIGALMGSGGTLLVQRVGNRRADGGVRREVHSRLRSMLAFMARTKVRARLPDLQRIAMALIERFRNADVALAFGDNQHFTLYESVDRVQSLLHTIDVFRKDVSYGQGIGEEPDFQEYPSEAEIFWIEHNDIFQSWESTYISIKDALVVLGDRKFVRLHPLPAPEKKHGE